MSNCFVAVRTQLADFGDVRIDLLGAYRLKADADRVIAKSQAEVNEESDSVDVDETAYSVRRIKLPADARGLWASLYEPSTTEYGDKPAVSLFPTKAEANNDARRKLMKDIRQEMSTESYTGTAIRKREGGWVRRCGAA